MADTPVDLDRFRRRRERQRRKEGAAENRARHGLSKTERELARAEKARTDRELDGKKLEKEPEPD